LSAAGAAPLVYWLRVVCCLSLAATLEHATPAGGGGIRTIWDLGIWACIDWVILVISLLINLFATTYDLGFGDLGMHRLGDSCDFIANQFVCYRFNYDIDLVARVHLVPEVCSAARDSAGSRCGINLFVTNLIYDIDLIARVHLVLEVCSATRDSAGSRCGEG
jgi:hypothetical protein